MNNLRNTAKVARTSAILFFIVTLSLLPKTGALAPQANESLPNNSKTSQQLNIEAYENIKSGNYDIAYALSEKSIELAQREGNVVEHARAISNLASGLKYLGQNSKALELYSHSLSISRSNKDYVGIDRALNNIASMYAVLEDHDESLKYRKLQLSNSYLTGNPEDEITASSGLVAAYANLGEITLAQQHVENAKRVLVTSPNAFFEIYLLSAETIIFDYFQDVESAISTMKVALQLATTNNYRGLVASLRNELANYYFISGNYLDSLKHAEFSLMEATSLGLKQAQADAHELLFKIHKQNGNHKKALKHYQLEQELSEFISGEKFRVLAEITKIDRQTAETKQMLKESQQNQEILTLRLEQQDQAQIIWLIALASVAILLLFILYRISAKRSLERQQALNKQLRELDIVKDRVLTNTSHELRTPLNGIIGLSDIILQNEEEKLSSSTLSSLKLIKKSGEQLALVINDILEFSRLKSKKLTVVKSTFCLTSIIRDVITVCEPSTVNKDVVIKYETHEEAFDVYQDRGRIQQILFNVIGNAIKFTRHGMVLVSAVANNDELLITVKDTGIGIPAEKTERIFEGFEQVDASDSREHSGSGLGLAISRGLAEALGGSLKLSSTLGEGTEIEIRLPC